MNIQSVFNFRTTVKTMNSFLGGTLLCCLSLGGMSSLAIAKSSIYTCLDGSGGVVFTDSPVQLQACKLFSFEEKNRQDPKRLAQMSKGPIPQTDQAFNSSRKQKRLSFLKSNLEEATPLDRMVLAQAAESSSLPSPDVIPAWPDLENFPKEADLITPNELPDMKTDFPEPPQIGEEFPPDFPPGMAASPFPGEEGLTPFSGEEADRRNPYFEQPEFNTEQEAPTPDAFDEAFPEGFIPPPPDELP